MLETLTQGFRRARDRFQGITRLTEDNVAEALRDVRMSLLEADVDLETVREFLEKVGERCAGEHVRTRSAKSGQRNSRLKRSASKAPPRHPRPIPGRRSKRTPRRSPTPYR